MQGAGSPTAMRIMIGREANIDRKKELAKVIAGIEEDSYFQSIVQMKKERHPKGDKHGKKRKAGTG